MLSHEFFIHVLNRRIHHFNKYVNTNKVDKIKRTLSTEVIIKAVEIQIALIVIPVKNRRAPKTF